tara:strand:- start:753 stop:1319 length:567 start_codon:yes stop_codon:yes gene_type:complete
MKVNKDFKIKGLIEFLPSVFKDERGEFIETYNVNAFKIAGLPDTFVQDNQSVSHKNVFRGIHLQMGSSSQGKLVRVSKGSVIDYAIDLRQDSPTFGKWESILLTAEKGNQFWVPAGFGHAFQSLEDDTIFCYKCTNVYDKASEVCILWSDEDINLTVDSPSKIQVSAKDEEGITLLEFSNKYLYNQIS